MVFYNSFVVGIRNIASKFSLKNYEQLLKVNSNYY